MTSLAVVGCSGWLPLLPDTRTPADRARELLPRCGPPADKEALAALSPDLVEAVEPAYFTVLSGNDRAVRLRGARLHIRPTWSASPEALQRALRCHQANVILTHADGVPDDPYAVSGTWLDINVQSGDDGLVASVLVDRFEYARDVLDRARGFTTRR